MTPCPPSTLGRLSFLAGHWRGELAQGFIEEVWLSPAAGVAQGAVRLVENGKIATIELIVVSAESDAIVMRYNHFNPDYTTWERDGPIELVLMQAHEGEALFSSLRQPPRDAAEMGYRLLSADRLHSWVFAVDADGARTKHEFEFKRVA
jgi:hypothetical protein